ncbi:MAG: peptidoglycan bridge formation glycyltransferase FemA/FemB family protein [Bacteroidales bacterium]|nr:peptidoglycan bridge formation glycyltransferase FemA/FemB family protein [Bacteroidales bacterium]
MIQLINPITDKRWLDFIENNNKTVIFHHPDWLQVLYKQYKFKVFIICCFNEKNKIIAGIPFCEIKNFLCKKKWVSLPFSDFCPPLFKDEKALLEIIDFLKQKISKKEISSIEIRSFLPDNSFFFQSNMHVIHIKNIENSINEIFKSFKLTQVQQPIKQAIRKDLTAEINNNITGIKEFYKLHLKTRKKLGVPIQPKKYFTHFYNELIQKKIGFTVLVKKDNLVISAGIFIGFGKYFTYKYSASNPEYLKLRPNNLMLWTGIQEAKKRGFIYFDFGRSSIDNKGLRNFKSAWGAKENELIYNFYPENQENGLLEKLENFIIKPLIKKGPPIICRMLGEIFYKYSV